MDHFETVMKPGQYLAIGNFDISKPPYMKTSLQELGAYGFRLWFSCKYMPTKRFSKVRFRFTPPDGGGPSINFDFCSDEFVGSDESVIQYLGHWNGKMLAGPVPKNPGKDALSIRRYVDPLNFVPMHRVSVPIDISPTLYDDWVAIHGGSEADIISFVKDEVERVFYGPKLEASQIRDINIASAAEVLDRKTMSNLACEIVLPEPQKVDADDFITFSTRSYSQMLRLDDPEAELVLTKFFNDRRAKNIKLPKGEDRIDLETIPEPKYDNVIDITELLQRIENMEQVSFGEKIAVNAK